MHVIDFCYIRTRYSYNIGSLSLQPVSELLASFICILLHSELFFVLFFLLSFYIPISRSLVRVHVLLFKDVKRHVKQRKMCAVNGVKTEFLH